MSNVSTTMQLALGHHQAGDLAQAERLYQDVLQSDPRNADAHHLLGLIAMQRGQPEPAIEHFRKALHCQPSVAQFHNHLGSALGATGQHLAAVECYREAVRIEPHSAEGHNDLANALRAVGQMDQAEICYRAAIAGNPQLAEAHNNLGNLMLARRQWAEAVASFEAAARLRPDAFEIFFNLGNCHQFAEDHAAAAVAYHRALALKPDFALAYHALGNSLSAQRQFAAAADCHRQALRLKPDHIAAEVGLGIALQESQDIKAAKACYHRALALKPADTAARYNLATALEAEGAYAEAEKYYRLVLEALPDHMDSLGGLSAIHLARGEHDAFWNLHERMFAIDPEHPEAHFLRAISLLSRGDFVEGWQEFEYRLKYRTSGPRAFEQPRWDGAALQGRTLLVHGEYGFGDLLQFIRYVRLVRASHPRARVVIEVRASLIPLLQASGFDALVASGSPLGEFDVHVPLMSLPSVFRTTLETIPRDVPYIHAQTRRVEAWKTRLAEIEGFRIGISWQGNKAYHGDRHRSMALSAFQPLAEVADVSLISLQKEVGCEQLAEVAGQFHVSTLAGLDEKGGAFMDTAAVMKNLDLVITSDSAVAHLAGAMGVPVWLAISAAPEWRWLRDRDDSPWYPSMRLFRQTKLDVWAEVFQRMASELRRRIASGSGP